MKNWTDILKENKKGRSPNGNLPSYRPILFGICQSLLSVVVLGVELGAVGVASVVEAADDFSDVVSVAGAFFPP